MSAATAWEVIEAAHGKGFSQSGECDGLWVTDQTYINFVDTRIDMDYLAAYLIEVCDVTDDAPEPNYYGSHEQTHVSYLAVFQRHAGLGGVTYSWYDGDDLAAVGFQKGRRPQASSIRFFDHRADYTSSVRHWFIDFVDGEHEAYAESLRQVR